MLEIIYKRKVKAITPMMKTSRTPLQILISEGPFERKKITPVL